jgi:hypothetical protein
MRNFSLVPQRAVKNHDAAVLFFCADASGVLS